MRSQGLLHQLNSLILNDVLNVFRIVVVVYHSLKVGTNVVGWRAYNLVMDLGYTRSINVGCGCVQLMTGFVNN